MATDRNKSPRPTLPSNPTPQSADSSSSDEELSSGSSNDSSTSVVITANEPNKHHRPSKQHDSSSSDEELSYESPEEGSSSSSNNSSSDEVESETCDSIPNFAGRDCADEPPEKRRASRRKEGATYEKKVNFGNELSKDDDIFQSDPDSDMEAGDDSEKKAKQRNQESYSYENIVTIYQRDPKKTISAVAGDIKAAAPSLDGDLVLNYAQRILAAIIKAFPSQHMWSLYTRWAKKTVNHYQTDTISIQCSLNKNYPQMFDNEVDILSSLRTLRYQPPKKPPSDPTKRSRRKTTNIFKNNISWVTSKHYKNITGPSLESDLAKQLSMFESIVKNSACMGKIGMRSGKGPEVMKQKCLLDGNVEGVVRTTSLMEFHKAPSFQNRLQLGVGDRSTSWWLLRLLFKKYSTPRVTLFSCLLTENAKQRYDFITILAGLCLKIKTLSHFDDAMKKKYFTEAGIRNLREEAEQLAQLNLTRDHQNSDIISTIKMINTRYGKCGQRHFHGQKSNRERQYLLLSALVFQSWYKFDRRETADMRTRLQRAFGERNSATNAARNPPVQDEPAFSTATNLERADSIQVAIDDYNEMLECQDFIENNAKLAIFSPDW